MAPYIQGAQLCVGILVSYATFERAHGFLWLDSLGADDIRNLEVEGDIFTVNVSTLAVADRDCNVCEKQERRDTYRLLPVALSICSSKALLAEDDHQPPIIVKMSYT